MNLARGVGLILALASASPGMAKPLDERERHDIYVEPVTLTEAAASLAAAVNVGAMVCDTAYAEGLQQAADIWGLNLDLFIVATAAERTRVADRLLEAGEYVIILDRLPGENWETFKDRAGVQMIQIRQVTCDAGRQREDRVRAGYAEMRAARAAIATRLPKLQEIMPIACPISPLPDSFFVPSRATVSTPVARMDRAFDSSSAPRNGLTAATVVSVSGNALERSSVAETSLFTLAIEAGTLSVQAQPGAGESARFSSILTGAVVAIRGPGGNNRDVALEHSASEPSMFKPAVQAPDEFEAALEEWHEKGMIAGFRKISDESWMLSGWQGRDRILRCGLFVTLAEEGGASRTLEPGVDDTGRLSIDFTSRRGFVQQLVEVVPSPPRHRKVPRGGPMTAGGGSTGATIGVPLADLLKDVRTTAQEHPSAVLAVEGGMLSVAPLIRIPDAQRSALVERVDIDVRGPLSTNQSVVMTLAGGDRLVLRRTVVDVLDLDAALGDLAGQGLVDAWRYEGVRGRGLGGNVVLDHFLGRRRTFMSSLFLRKISRKPARPRIRLYVDGLHRLAFSFQTTSGWEQQFVEIPVRVPPVPRDVVLSPVPTQFP